MQNLSDYLKKFPHQGGIIVCEEKKFIYMKACKTAGTSILRHSLEKKINTIFHYKDNRTKYLNWINQLNETEISKYFIFSFIRNPFDRVVSLCSHFGMSIDLFIKNYKSRSLEKKIFEHSIPLFNYNYFNNKKFTHFVGRFENIDNDYLKICKYLNIEEEKLPHTNKTNHLHYKNYYNERQIIEISEIYKNDLINFNYSY